MRSANPGKRLDSLLSGLEKKRSRFLFLRGLAGTALLFTGGLCAVSLLSLLYNSPLYYAILKILAAASAAFGVYRFIYIPLFRDRSSGNIVRELDRKSPGLGEDALNASELNRMFGEGADKSGTSPALVSAHIGELTKRLESSDLSSLFPLKSLKRYALPLAGGVIAAVAVLIFTPGNFTAYLLSLTLLPHGNTPALELADIEISLDYPGYTGILPQTVKGSAGDIKALKGTQVRFRARPVGPFKGGRLSAANGASYPVSMEDGRITVEFPVLESGSYKIIEESGALGTKEFQIEAENDEVPTVTIRSPQGEEIDAELDGRIDIFYEASDDFGLTEFRLSWETESGKTGRLIAKAENTPASFEDRYTFDLGGVDFGKGDTLKLRVEAYDNDTVSGPKEGVSNAITVRLKDAGQKHRDVMNFAAQLMEEMIDILGDEIEISGAYKTAAPDNNEGEETVRGRSAVSIEAMNSGELLNTQNGLTVKIENASVTLNKTLETMMDDNYSDYTYFLGLSNMDVRIDELLKERRELLESFAMVDIPRLRRLMRREITEFEDDILFLDSMIKGERLRESLLSGKELLKEYGELSEMLEQLNRTGDESLKAEIRKKLDELQGLMSELAQKMGAMSGEIQEGFLNRDAFKSMDMQQKLDRIRKLTEEGETEQAMQMLSELAERLQSMIASLESGYQSFAMSSLSRDISKLNELIARIGGLEREEATLREKTENLKESLLENPGAAGDNLRSFIEREKKKVEEIKENLARAKSKISKEGQKGDTPDGSYLLDSLMQKAEELKNWLDAMDMGESRKIAETLEGTSQGLIELSDAGVGNLRKSRQELEKSGLLAKEIRQDLDRFIKSGEREPRSEVIAKRQEEIKDETGGLSEDTDKLMENILLSPGVGEKIAEAEGHMGKASESLNGNELSKAISNQDEAEKALKEARAEAEGLLQKMQAMAQGGGSSVPMVLGQKQYSRGMQGVDTRNVEIPVAEESRIGKEFKERILEAMKGGSPEGYGELNRKYYDRIIK